MKPFKHHNQSLISGVAGSKFPRAQPALFLHSNRRDGRGNIFLAWGESAPEQCGLINSHTSLSLRIAAACQLCGVYTRGFFTTSSVVLKRADAEEAHMVVNSNLMRIRKI